MNRFFWSAAVLLFALATGQVCQAAGAHGEYSLRRDLPFWGIVYFLLFLFVFWKLLWNWWRGSMTEREHSEVERIAVAEREGRAAAELLSDRLGRMEAIDEDVRGLLEEARRDADHTRTHILDSARSEADAARRRAVRDIDRTRDQTLKEVFDYLTSRTIERTREVLSSRLNESDQRRLVQEALTQFRQQAT